MGELKPCPFCGHSSDHIVYDDFWDGRHYWMVECASCSARGASEDTEMAAREAWNRRSEFRKAKAQQAQDDGLQAQPSRTHDITLVLTNAGKGEPVMQSGAEEEQDE